MEKSKYWFTLIEVIVATWIITIAVFWVYKLISENTKIISNSSNNLQTALIFPVLEQCIDNIWVDAFYSDTSTWYIFNFWSSEELSDCNTWALQSVVFDNIEYLIEWEVLERVNPNYIDWELSISSDNNSSTWFFKQIKK